MLGGVLVVVIISIGQKTEKTEGYVSVARKILQI
jgi:hypothetical protein